MDWFKKLEDKAKRLFFIISLVSVIGASGLTKMITSYNTKIKRQHTTIQVLSAQVQIFHPDIYEGRVEIFRRKFFGLWKKSEGVFDVQIRYMDTFDELMEEMTMVYWVYLRVDGVMEIYHAVPYDNTFYFLDWADDRQWVTDLKKVY